MEEEKAIWSSKEKALTEAMEEKMSLYNIKIESLSKEMAEVCPNRKSHFLHFYHALLSCQYL